MFKKHIVILLLIWTAFAFGIVGFFSSLTNSDKRSYLELLSYANIATENHKESQITQQRLSVSKHFLQSKDDERLQFYLRSESSELIYDKQSKKAEIIERFNDMTCLVQEKLMFQPTPSEHGEKLVDNLVSEKKINDPKNSKLEKQQIVRQIQSNDAIYHYNSRDFLADEVKVERYMAPGHELNFSLSPLLVLMKGTASRVEFNIQSDSKLFKAHKLKATFQDAGTSQ